MNLRSLTQGLSYVGEVPAKRQTYHVFEAKKYFLLMSQSRAKRNAGNFNVVRSDAVEYVAKRFERKKKVTSTEVDRASRKLRLVSTKPRRAERPVRAGREGSRRERQEVQE